VAEGRKLNNAEFEEPYLDLAQEKTQPASKTGTMQVQGPLYPGAEESE
jgi:hypothetical protein